MNTFLSVLTGPSGKISTMRVSVLYIVVVIIGVWGYISVAKLELQKFDESTVALLGLALGAKVWQRKQESETKAPS